MQKNKLSFDEIKKVIPANDENYATVDWKGIKFRIKTILSLEEMMGFVHGVVTSCFAEDTGEYLPEIKEFAVRCAVLEDYGNIELPDDLNEKYALVCGTDIVDCIAGSVDSTQLEDILNAIDEKVEHIAQSNIEALNKKMAEVVAKFESLEANISKVFSAVDADTVTKVASAVASGAFDEKKLVQAFSHQASAQNQWNDPLTHGGACGDRIQ